MKRPILIKGMQGLGDNLHQRALIRQFLEERDVWLESCWVAPYHDLIGAGLKVVQRQTVLRTQAKNAAREAGRFHRGGPPPRTQAQQIAYTPRDVNARGSVLAAMCHAAGRDYDRADFRMPVPAAWRAKASALLVQLRPPRPVMVYRPLVERSEWTGCGSRNPDFGHYAQLFDSIRDQFFVVSIADLEPGKEWLTGQPRVADITLHRGELDFETLAGLTAQAGLVFTSPGFAVILAQAVGTPSVCVYGGYESPRTFEAGGRYVPYLPIAPIRPCACWRHGHACDKRIDMPAALANIRSFVNDIAASSAIVA